MAQSPTLDEARGAASVGKFDDGLIHAMRDIDDGTVHLSPLCGKKAKLLSRPGDRDPVCLKCVPLMYAELGMGPEEVEKDWGIKPK